MDLAGSATASARRAAESLEAVASASGRPRLLRIVDPWDVAGHAARTVLPSHATPVLAHVAYYAVLAGFVAVEIVDSPVALLLGAGHLMLQSHNRVLQQVGAAVDDGA